MTEEDQVPEWARELAEAVAATIEFQAQASLECLHAAPEDTELGVDLVELWPAVMEIQEAGPNDGELVYGIVDRFDLLAAQKLFEELEEIHFGFEIDAQPKITIQGTYKGRKVIVVVYFEPELGDDEEDEEAME